MSIDLEKLERGELVAAARDIDNDGLNIKKGTKGVVYEPAGYYDPDEGPAVRFVDGSAICARDGQICFPQDFEEDLDDVAADRDRWLGHVRALVEWEPAERNVELCEAVDAARRDLEQHDAGRGE